MDGNTIIYSQASFIDQGRLSFHLTCAYNEFFDDDNLERIMIVFVHTNESTRTGRDDWYMYGMGKILGGDDLVFDNSTLISLRFEEVELYEETSKFFVKKDGLLVSDKNQNSTPDRDIEISPRAYSIVQKLLSKAKSLVHANIERVHSSEGEQSNTVYALGEDAIGFNMMDGFFWTRDFDLTLMNIMREDEFWEVERFVEIEIEDNLQDEFATESPDEIL